MTSQVPLRFAGAKVYKKSELPYFYDDYFVSLHTKIK